MSRKVSWTLAIVLAAGVIGANIWRPAGSTVAGSVDTNCGELDRAATEALAPLLHDASAAAEWTLDQALQQLRRARRNCRAGSVELAGNDYNALIQAHPVLTASTRTRSGAGTDVSSQGRSGR
jgi:hypothetical protein